ncbi:hypothetical protein BJX68DRAFT_117826 [Aspergillus pseudodeflectus]|uniref:Uncharacterized protein n=1 Tax=Aspergillus pseudodeflectus TaxID=176178 RepID=A0ABR4L5S8_9EURO
MHLYFHTEPTPANVPLSRWDIKRFPSPAKSSTTPRFPAKRHKRQTKSDKKITYRLK